MNKPFIIKNNAQPSTSWSGGETTELFIFPEAAEYSKLNFDFRLSTATVNVKKSVFTPLNGIRRTLIVLKGYLKLEHENHHVIDLGPFDSDSFWGDWKTTSMGRVLNFNIMMGNSTHCQHEVLNLGQSECFNEINSQDFSCFFLFQGDLDTNCGVMTSGDILIVPKEGLCQFESIADSVIIRILVSLI